MICHNLLDSVIVAPTLPPVTLKWGCVLFWPYLWRLRFVFHLISLCNRILFFLWFFFFCKFSPPANAKITLGSDIIQKQAVGWIGPLGWSWLTPQKREDGGVKWFSHLFSRRCILKWNTSSMKVSCSGKEKESQKAASQPLPSSFFAPSHTWGNLWLWKSGCLRNPEARF